MARKKDIAADTFSPKGKARVRFIFEPDRSSPNGITYAWLIHRTYKGKEKAATAARAFWLPFAYRDSGDYSETELKELAQQSIWRMEEQIQYLRESFGLESTPALVGESSSVPESAVNSPPPVTNVDLFPAKPATTKDQSLSIGDQALLTDDLLDEFADVV